MYWLDWKSIEKSLKRDSGWNDEGITKESVERFADASCRFLYNLPEDFGVIVNRKYEEVPPLTSKD
jgi:hypothetical protein